MEAPRSKSAPTLRHFLHLVQEEGHRVRLGVAGEAVLDAVDHDQAAEMQIPYPVSKADAIFRLRRRQIAVRDAEYKLRNAVAKV